MFIIFGNVYKLFMIKQIQIKLHSSQKCARKLRFLYMGFAGSEPYDNTLSCTGKKFLDNTDHNQSMQNTNSIQNRYHMLKYS